MYRRKIARRKKIRRKSADEKLSDEKISDENLSGHVYYLGVANMGEWYHGVCFFPDSRMKYCVLLGFCLH